MFRDKVESEPTTLKLALEYYKDNPDGLLEWAKRDAEELGDPEGADRAADFNYELRHPGHGDQSVHNPHKGGNSAGGWAAGEWKSLDDAERLAMHQRVAADWIKSNPDKVNEYPFATEQSVIMLLESEASGKIIYQNGNVQVRFGAGETQFDDAKVAMDGIDNAMAFTPVGMRQAGYPLQVEILPMRSSLRGNFVGDSPQGGVIKFNSTYVAQGGLIQNANPLGYKVNSAKSIYPQNVFMRPEIAYGTSAVKYTAAHEIGHAVMAFNNETTVFGMPNIIKLGYISKYAKKNKFERYAETFAAFTLGQRDSVTKQFEESHGWVAP